MGHFVKNCKIEQIATNDGDKNRGSLRSHNLSFFHESILYQIEFHALLDLFLPLLQAYQVHYLSYLLHLL